MEGFKPSKRLSIIDEGQTERVIINLKNWDGEISGLQKQFTDYPVPNLKELMIIDKNNLLKLRKTVV